MLCLLVLLLAKILELLNLTVKMNFQVLLLVFKLEILDLRMLKDVLPNALQLPGLLHGRGGKDVVLLHLLNGDCDELRLTVRGRVVVDPHLLELLLELSADVGEDLLDVFAFKFEILF